MLAFAAALHAKVAALPVGGGGTGSKETSGTAVRMGMATGEAVFYVGGDGSSPFASVTGAAAAAAARMEAQAGPGLARVHRSTADKWAAEARRAPPATVRVEGGAGREMERAAEFDCAAGEFRNFAASAAASAAAASGDRSRQPGGGAPRSRRFSLPALF